MKTTIVANILAGVGGVASAIIARKLGYQPFFSIEYWLIFVISMIPSISILTIKLIIDLNKIKRGE